MNTRIILDDPDRVGSFVKERIGRRAPWFDIKAIGHERDGELIAGVVYEDYTGNAIQGHVAAEHGSRWMTPSFLWACFYYPFKQLGVRCMYGQVSAANLAAQRLDEHLGFKRLAVLEGAAPGGEDLIIYVMRPEECRFLELCHVEQ